MVWKKGLMLAILVAASGQVGGQEESLPPAPIPVLVPPPPAQIPLAPPPRQLPPAPMFPPPPVVASPPPAIMTDYPRLSMPEVIPPGAAPGWFAALELDVVVPHIKNRLQARVPIEDFFTTRVHLPTTELAWTAAPRFELGYRLPDGFTEFLVSYRFLISEGCAGYTRGDETFLVDTTLKSRLDVNVIDLDYAQRPLTNDGTWEMKWKIGARIANVFFDSLASVQVFDRDADFDFTDAARTSNYFFGAGPHAGLDLQRNFGASGWGLFGRIEGALVVGRISQSFERTFLLDDGSRFGGARSQHSTQAVPVLNAQAGLSWKPSFSPSSRFSAGYQYEHWWELGQVGDSRAELWDQGIFLRAEYKY